MSNARYSDEYMQSVYDRITDLEKENDNLRVAMKSMASAVTVKDLNNTIDALARCTKVDTKVKTDLLAQIHRLEDTLVTSTLADAARTNASKDKLEEAETELVNALRREDRLLKVVQDQKKTIDKMSEGFLSDAAKIHSLEDEIFALKERLRNNFQSTTINRLEDDLRASQKELAAAKEAGVQLQIEVSDLKEERDLRKTEVVRTTASLVNVLNRESRLLKDNKELRGQLLPVVVEATEANKARDEYCEGNRNLSQELAAAREYIVDLKDWRHAVDQVLSDTKEDLRACRVDKDHKQNTINDLDTAATETWVYIAKLRKTNAALEDTIRKLETEQYEHSQGVLENEKALEKDHAALNTLNKMLLKNNKELRASVNRLENGHIEDAFKNVKDFLQFLADNFEDKRQAPAIPRAKGSK